MCEWEGTDSPAASQYRVDGRWAAPCDFSTVSLMSSWMMPMSFTPVDAALARAFVDADLGIEESHRLLANLVEEGSQLSVVTCMRSEAGSAVDEFSEMVYMSRSTAWMTVRRDRRGDFPLVVLPTQLRNIVHLVATVPYSDYRWRKIERWLSRSRTPLSEFWIDLDDFLTIGSSLEAHGETRASRTTGRSVLDDSSITRGWRSGKPQFGAAIDEMLSYPASVRSVTVRVDRLLHAQIRRRSGATIYGGSFDLFRSVILDQLANAGQSRLDLLTGRERQLDRPIEKGLAIRLESDTFADPVAASDLAKLLYSDSELGVAVLHSNPYFHAAVTDYTDGSTFDVFVTAPDEVVILPGYRSLPGALSRISDRIGDRFSSSALHETDAETKPTLEDLFGDG